MALSAAESFSSCVSKFWLSVVSIGSWETVVSILFSSTFPPQLERVKASEIPHMALSAFDWYNLNLFSIIIPSFAFIITNIVKNANYIWKL